MIRIPYSKPLICSQSLRYLQASASSDRLSGDSNFSSQVYSWFKSSYGNGEYLLTPSCTASLELAALALNIREGDEVIMPSYTFVSTANAFALRGARIKFVDIDPDTLNIDPKCVAKAITRNTKAIVPVHYAGLSCDMDEIIQISKNYGISVVEDAAQSIGAKYKGSFLGTFGSFGCMSFHDTKNITSGGEGGLLLVNDEKYSDSARIIREKGTNRHHFIAGKVDKYSWIMCGSSYLASDIQAAFLLGALENVNTITEERLLIWERYQNNLRGCSSLKLMEIPSWSTNNGHIFYFLLKNNVQRSEMLKYLNENGVQAVSHYVPLHSSIAGKKYGDFIGDDRYTTRLSESIVRLPLWNGLGLNEVDWICELITEFVREKNY